MVRKSFSPSNCATSREDENAPASKAPNCVALRLTPLPRVATTWPLLSSNITEVALVSAINLCSEVEIIVSSRSEMIRFVSCSMHATPSVYRLCIDCQLQTNIMRYQELQEFHGDWF